MSIIRKARENDIAAVTAIFERILDEEEAGRVSIGWRRGVYPTGETAAEAFEQGDLFVMEVAGNIVAAMRINREQVPEYKNCRWDHPADDHEIMVAHTLVVDPAAAGRGYGRRMIAFYEQYAREHHCPCLRMDTNAINTRARALYRKLGYKEIGITPCVFNGIGQVNLVCLEKKLGQPGSAAC